MPRWSVLDHGQLASLLPETAGQPDECMPVSLGQHSFCWLLRRNTCSWAACRTCAAWAYDGVPASLVSLAGVAEAPGS